MIRHFFRSLCAALLLAAVAAPAVVAASPPRHSMSQYAYLIGTWRCLAHIADGKTVAYTTSFRWQYPSHAVIDQTFAGRRGQADFLLTYTSATDSFHGVFVDSSGNAGFWENPGPVAGGWTEYGYDVAHFHQPNTRAIFYGATPTHYAFHFFNIADRADPGTPIESDVCYKT